VTITIAQFESQLKHNNNILQNFPLLNIMTIHSGVPELFLANRLTGQFYYSLQRDVNMPKMTVARRYTYSKT